MTAEQFAALGALLYGQDWRRQTADALGVSLRNVQFWAARPPARCKPIPPGVEADMRSLTRMVMTDPLERALAAQTVAEMTATARFLAQAIGLENVNPGHGGKHELT